MEPNLDRAVIALDPASMPRFSDFEAEILAPADLSAGDRVGVVEIIDWSSIGDLHQMNIRVHGEAVDLAVLVKPRDTNADTFLRTARWNISYTGEQFDETAEALLREVAKRLEWVAKAREMDAEALHQRYFRRPGKEEYLEITGGKKLYLRVTDHCNENCIFCNATEGNQNVVSSKTALRRILDGLPAGELAQVIFSGGEPTLVKALPEYVATAYEAGARDIIIQSNGYLLDRDGALDKYLPFRDRLGIGFSLHSLEPRLSDIMTGAQDVPNMPLAQRYAKGLSAPVLPPEGFVPTDHLARKLEAIDRAVELGFRVKITFVVMGPNLAEVPRFAEQCWQRWGARLERLQFSYAMPRGNAWLNKELVVRFSECVEPFAEAFELGRRTGLRIESSQTAATPPCTMPDYIDHMDIYGDYTGGKTSDSERVKPASKCEGCEWDRICPGVWQRYIDVFGTDELTTMRDRPLPVGVIDDFTEGTVLDLDGRAGDAGVTL